MGLLSWDARIQDKACHNQGCYRNGIQSGNDVFAGGFRILGMYTPGCLSKVHRDNNNNEETSDCINRIFNRIFFFAPFAYRYCTGDILFKVTFQA